MNVQVTIGFNPEALSAISDLTDAIRSIGSSQSRDTALTPLTHDTEYPAYWRDAARGSVGIAKTAADYDLLRRNIPKIYKISESMYLQHLEANKAEAEQQAAAAQEKVDEVDEKSNKAEKSKPEKAAKAEKSKPEKAAKAEKSKPETAVDVPSEQDLIAVFQQYLPENLDKAVRAERYAFVKPMLARFGAPKVSALDAEYRALAINLVTRKMAGEDVDPETAEYAEITDADDDVI